MLRASLGPVLCLFAGATSTPLLSAQCTTSWASTGGFPGVNGLVEAAVMHDPDGPGPSPARLILAGSFNAVGDLPVANVAAWDPATGLWSPLGAGVPSGVRALAVLPNGDLVAAGGFGSAAPAFGISRWNGATWLPMGAGFSDSVNGAPAIHALTVMANGDLIAAGWFTSAGGVPANRIARWDGVAWSALGTGLDYYAFALTTMANGDLVAGGLFSSAGGVAVNHIARWDGTAWSPIGLGMSGGVWALEGLPNGELHAGWTVSGSPFVPPASRLGRWNGASWSQVGTNTMQGWIRSITTLPGGDVLMAGGHGTLGAWVGFCERWNGSAWSSLGPSPVGEVAVVAQLPNGDVLAGGAFGRIGLLPAKGAARWDGAMWHAFGVPGLAGRGWALAITPNGDILAGGDMVLRWNGTAWLPLGGTITSSSNQPVFALVALANGDVVAGGSLNSVGGVPANFIASWNGTSWQPMGAGMNDTVLALATLPDGTLVAGGMFSVAGGVSAKGLARWNGSVWSPLGGGVTIGGQFSGIVNALAVAPNGDLFVAGTFDRAGTVAANFIARWNGVAWSPLGAGTSSDVGSLAALPNGDLIAGGNFLSAGGVVVNSIGRWNGSVWSALGSGVTGSVSAIVALPNNDFLVGGDLSVAGGVAVNRLARWNGASWSAVGSGLDRSVYRLAFRPAGEVFVGGDFAFAGGLVSPGVARLATSCPAMATATGGGCVGVGGPNVLTATSLPWGGATFSALASGMPSGSLAVVVSGLSAQTTPLSAILPQGSPGCSLLVSPDLLTAALTGAGTVSVALTIPNTGTLAGLAMRQQVVALEIAAGNIAAVTSTNALVLQFGAF